MNFLYLRDEGCLTDVVLRVPAGDVKAHRLVLSARSTGFRAMFEGPYEEARTGVVAVPDVEYGIMTAFIKALYKGSVRGTNTADDEDLYRLAHKYQMGGMVEAFEERFASGLTVHNFCRRLLLADTTSAVLLKEESFAFMNRRSLTVSTSDGWRQLWWRRPPSYCGGLQEPGGHAGGVRSIRPGLNGKKKKQKN